MPDNVQRTKYADIQAYLDAIADHPQAVNSVDNAVHGRFWTIAHTAFVSGNVPNVRCTGAPIPLVDTVPDKCPLLQALTTPAGWCNKRQMPRGGPFVTDDGYSVTLRDGTVVSGKKIIEDITWWLTHGMPET